VPTGISKDENCCGIHWDVLDWHKKAIELYKQLDRSFAISGGRYFSPMKL